MRYHRAIRGCMAAAIVVVAVAVRGQAADEFSYGVYIADDAVLSALMEEAKEQSIKFRAWDSDPGAVYLLTDEHGHSRIRSLHDNLRSGRSDGWFITLKVMLRSLVGLSTVTESISYEGNCIHDIDWRDTMLRNFVENEIDHSFGNVEEGYCIYWFTEDKSKPGSKIAELVDNLNYMTYNHGYATFSPWPPDISSGHRMEIDCGGDNNSPFDLVDDWPIIAVCRSPQDIEKLGDMDDEVFDPEASNEPGGRLRSVRDDVFVVVGVSPHSRCGLESSLPHGSDWPVVFTDLCGDAAWDMAGRQIKSPSGDSTFIGNLVVPKYRYVSDTMIEFE